MTTAPSFSRLIQHFSPQVWLAIALVSFLLAVGSGGFLYTQLSVDQKGELLVPYDAVSRFVRDTIRLTFKTDQYVESVFVAPKQILEQSASFTWVDQYQDFVPLSDEAPPEPKAPVRLLDPQWNPDFAGVKDERDANHDPL